MSFQSYWQALGLPPEAADWGQHRNPAPLGRTVPQGVGICQRAECAAGRVVAGVVAE